MCKKVVVIFNGVNIDKYFFGVFSLKIKLNVSLIFLYLGCIFIVKNIEFLFKVWKYFDMVNDSCLAIVGDGLLVFFL